VAELWPLWAQAEEAGIDCTEAIEEDLEVEGDAPFHSQQEGRQEGRQEGSQEGRQEGSQVVDDFAARAIEALPSPRGEDDEEEAGGWAAEMERRKEEAREAILADRTRKAPEKPPEEPGPASKTAHKKASKLEAFPLAKPASFFKKREKDKLPAKPILPPKLQEGGATPKSVPSAKRQQIEAMFKKAPKRFERKPTAKPKANEASMDAILERAKKL